mmetsp:Transcript_4690/g.3893  ORF Transcript_4690/g.3893 Transcript_4690/m.3893 type:complete len:118 (-) Transcript_4690:258-611(-)
MNMIIDIHRLLEVQARRDYEHHHLYQALEDIVENLGKRSGGWSDLKQRFKILWSCPRQVAIVTLTNVFTQFSGTNAQTFFQDTIFQDAGLKDSSVLAITVRVASTVATLPSMYLHTT